MNLEIAVGVPSITFNEPGRSDTFSICKKRPGISVEGIREPLGSRMYPYESTS
jgi:hypothetical protein